MRTLTATPITADAFALYGDVLQTPATPPRQDRAAQLENHRGAAAANLALVRSDPAAQLMPLQRLERHPYSSQTFLPLAVAAYLVMVAPDRDGAPDEARLRAFRVPGHVGISYRTGTWHAHMMTVAAPGTFAMLVHEDETADDCVFAPIVPLLIEPSFDPAAT